MSRKEFKWSGVLRPEDRNNDHIVFIEECNGKFPKKTKAKALLGAKVRILVTSYDDTTPDKWVTRLVRHCDKTPSVKYRQGQKAFKLKTKLVEDYRIFYIQA